jgi:hypothetical protein
MVTCQLPLANFQTDKPRSRCDMSVMVRVPQIISVSRLNSPILFSPLLCLCLVFPCLVLNVTCSLMPLAFAYSRLTPVLSNAYPLCRVFHPTHTVFNDAISNNEAMQCRITDLRIIWRYIVLCIKRYHP